jgi:hypothetical protein
MYPITSAGLAALREDVVQSVNILCTPTKGMAFNITDKDIIGAVTVDWSSVTGSKLDLGSACMSELSFTLENTDGAFDDKVFEGAQLYVTTSFSAGSTTETVPIGYYTVDSPPRKLRSIKITAYDRMAKFNRAYDTELAYPATLYQIIADACTKCGVSQKLPTNTLHRGVSIPKRPEADNLTYRQVLVWAAELMGVSLYIDYDGKLTGGWYATNAKHTVIKASDRFTSGNTDFAENNIVFSGVRIVGNDENKTEYLAGTKDYAFNIEGNLLAQSDMNLSTLATELKTARCSLTYTPMSCTTHSFPHLRPLDVMNFETAQGTKKVVLTNVKWQSQNRCTKLEGKGETATQSGYATMGAFTPKQQAVLEQTRAQQAAQINDYEQATLALNETIANSMGLYVTRKADSSGAVITYYHDKPTLEGSNTIYCRNAGGYAWTNNGWNNGSPNWEYGVSKDGDAVIRSIAANKISASYITTDILSSPTGKFSFNLDTGKIIASDADLTGVFCVKGSKYNLKIINTSRYVSLGMNPQPVLGLEREIGETKSGFIGFVDSQIFPFSSLTYDVCIDSTKGVRIDSGDAYTDVVCKEDKGFRVRGAEDKFGSSNKYFVVTKGKTEASGTFVSNSFETNTFAGLQHYRRLSDDDAFDVCRVDFGLGIPKADTPSGAIEVRNRDGEVTARLDLYQPRAGEVTLRLQTSDDKIALLFVNKNGLYAQFGTNEAKLLT